MVAKSYQSFPQIGEPYVQENGKMYVKIQKGTAIKEVRWYSAAEYAKMYPGEVVEEETPFKNQKHMLGFTDDYITIFKGDQEKHEDWFNRSIARYCVHWGWYIVSEDMVPFDLPADLEPVELKWEMVGIGCGLRPIGEVNAAVEVLLSGSDPSMYQGNIGDRLELSVVVAHSEQIKNHFGGFTAKHIFKDDNGNYYAWDTGAKFWAEGCRKHFKGTVKEHKVINGIQTTVLNRCIEC